MTVDAALAAIGRVGWVDWTLLAVLAASTIVGLVRGFVFEVLSLAGWVAAWFAAQWAAPHVAPHLPVGDAGGALRHGASFLLGFVVALLAWSLAARVVRMLVRATPLSLPDRVLGAGFGALRAGVLLLAAATVVALTPAAQSAPWRGSHGARWLGDALAWLKPVLPLEAARRLPDRRS